MPLICSGDVQYVNCCYTRGKRTLAGERGNAKRTDPSFELHSDTGIQEIQLKIIDILPEDMYAKPKEHVDIYILSQGANILKQGLETILPIITAAITLDRGNRDPRDPTQTYENTGVALEIDSMEAWIKISSIKAYFSPDNYYLESIKTTGVKLPRLNIDVEKSKSRLHIGVEIDWQKVDQKTTANYIEINIPWSECGHLLQALNSVITKVK
ncbi:hypothetical protein [Ferruginibacter sp.]